MFSVFKSKAVPGRRRAFVVVVSSSLNAAGVVASWRASKAGRESIVFGIATGINIGNNTDTNIATGHGIGTGTATTSVIVTTIGNRFRPRGPRP